MKNITRSQFLATVAAGAIAPLARPALAQRASPGIDATAKTVTVGAFTPVTGPVPFYAILTRAADAFFRHINENGGIRGWQVRYATMDDGYEPSRSVAVTRRLVEEQGIFALVAAVGTATNVAVIPYAREQGLPIIGPIGGASAFFTERHVFPLLPDYGWSAASNAEHALDGLNLRRVALLWENDELGRSAKRGFDKYMASRGIEPAESQPFDVRATDFTPQIRRLINAQADGVVMFGSNANLAAALRSANRSGYSATWFAPFFTADPSTYRLASNLLDGTYFSSWLLPVGGTEPAVTDYRSAAARFAPNDPVGVFGLNGWSNAALFAVGFEKLLDSGLPLTRPNLIDAMEQVTDASVGGARNVSFKAGDHRGTRREGIIQAKDGQFSLVREFRPYPAAAFDMPG
ncbi:ABC transporter substrate-binding protein [Humitalea sp. 24SJ18S-53]|uniref:ABC transporter substrate-binding protein n=1 Tax=Humitalea sp. 24SJ18S-53 TaxID=3422307 RepID=UPI003D67EDA7